MKKLLQDKKALSYTGLIFVVFIWGASPPLTKWFLNYYSPTFNVAWGSLVSSIALAIILRKKLKNVTKEYFKVAIPLGLFYTIANLSQKIGLQYTSPAKYSFLENLSCIVVPFLMWLFIKKKPAVLQFVGSAVCLISAFILSGLGFSGQELSIGKGEILCALAGIFYGVNIAGTGAFTKKFDSGLYIMILMAVESIVSLIVSLGFHFIKIDGVPIEVIRFSWDPLLLLGKIAITLISSTLCWTIRTNSMKHVDATVVAVMMPFSSVITSICSVMFGMDSLTVNLFVGATLGLLAMIICAFGDMASDKKAKGKVKTNECVEQG